MSERFITAGETAELLGMSRSRFYSTWKQLGIPAYDWSGTLKFLESEVVEWAKGKRVQ